MAQTEPHATAVAHPGGEAHSAGFPPFDSSTFASQLLWLAISFGLFYWLLSTKVLPRISGILEARADRIARDLAEAQRLKAESDAAGAAYEAALAAARRMQRWYQSTPQGAAHSLFGRDGRRVEGRLEVELADDGPVEG